MRETQQRMNKIGPPAGWREEQAVSPPPNTAYNIATGRWEVPQPAAVASKRTRVLWDDDYEEMYGVCTPSRYRSRTAQRRNSLTYRLDELAAPAPIVYAQYDPAFDPDLDPLSAPVDDSADGELPPGMTPAAWLAQRHLVSVARRTVADPARVSYVPVQELEEPQLVVTPAGFRFANRFNYLELERKGAAQPSAE